MTNSRSSISISKLLIVVATLVLWAGSARAERRRIVVLEFEGPKAEKFHEDVVKLLKKSHTVVSVEKWNGAAEELDAAKVTSKNVKKVAKKLKIDGVVTGIVEKRRDEYIIRLKLRAGTTGEPTGSSVQTKAEGPRLDGQAQRDIKEELVAAIDELDSNRGGGGDEEEEEDTPKKKKKGGDEDEAAFEDMHGAKKKKGEDEEEDAPKKSGFSRKKGEEEEKPGKKAKVEEDEEKPSKKKLAEEGDEKAALSTKKDKKDKKDTSEGDEEDTPKSKKRPKSSDEGEDEGEDEDGGRKKKASADEEEEESVEDEAEEEEDAGDAALKLSPAHRAIDAVIGLSFTARKLKFTYSPDLGKVPPGYRQTIPVAGAFLDLTAYPMAFGHKDKGIIGGIGLTVLYDKVLLINSQKHYADGAGMQQTADLKTEESRWAVGAVFRYPVTTGPKAIVVGGSLTYGKQKFTVQQILPNNEKTDIPNVNYTMITPAAFLRFPVTPQIIFNLDAAFHGITDTGDIQTSAQYGAAKVTGFELNTGIDYMLLKNVFVRGEFRYETIGFKFKGDMTSMTHTRDTDPEQDVTGARDSYIGGTATVGYLY